MKKLLIIGDDPLVIQAIGGACKTFGYDEIDICTHIQVIEGFHYQGFSHIIVLDYNEDPRSRAKEGFNAWGFLKAMAKDSQKILRCGYSQCAYSDYIKLPLDLAEFGRILEYY